MPEARSSTVFLYNEQVSKEHKQSAALEIASELVQAYIQVFFSRYDCYAIQQSDGSYRCVKRPLRTEMVLAHLRGDLTLGTYALDQNNTTRWLCLDADRVAPWEQLQKLAATLALQNIPGYLETSRRGGHLWLFILPTPAAQMRAFGRALMKLHPLEDVELYPKQDYLKAGPGSQMRLPLGIHRITGKRYPFIQPDQQLLAPILQEQLKVMAAPEAVSSEEIQKFSAKIETVDIRTLTPLRPKQTLSRQAPLSERLKQQISVYEFVSQHVALDEQGRGLCPFHDDQIQSFQVNRMQNYWHCYAGCGGGSLIDFWSRWRQMHAQDGSFMATIKDLAQILL